MADITAASIVYNGLVVQVQPGDVSTGGAFFTFDITSLLANPTAEAELQNYGAMLRIDETIPPSGQRFASFTSANSASYTAPFVELTVVPEPSSSILVMAGLAAITCLLKKRHARC